MRASSIAVEILYRGLLAGNDPRWVLHELRQRLRIDLPDTHDWASIVAYAAIAPDLDAQVDTFRSRQTKRKMEVMFGRMDELVATDAAVRTAQQSAAVGSELERLCSVIRADLAAWCAEAAAERNPKERAERLGLSAASEKRIAIIYTLFKDDKQEHELLTISRANSTWPPLKSEPVNHWVMTQFLSMAATPTLATEDAELEGAGQEVPAVVAGRAPARGVAARQYSIRRRPRLGARYARRAGTARQHLRQAGDYSRRERS